MLRMSEHMPSREEFLVLAGMAGNTPDTSLFWDRIKDLAVKLKENSKPCDDETSRWASYVAYSVTVARCHILK